MNKKPKLPAANPATDSGFGFDWNLIQTFLAVIDEGSLLAAAKRSGISQPTIGRHIEQLELQLGVALFERTGRALVATATARQIAELARSMELGANRIANTITSATTTQAGLVRVSASRMVAVHLLPEFALQCQREAPEIDIAVVATDEISNLLRRDADIAIRMAKPAQANLIAKRLGNFHIKPCASQAYIDRWGMPRTLPDLFNHRLVCPDNDEYFTSQIIAVARKLGVEKNSVKLAFRCDDHVTQHAAIRAGTGLGFLADYVLDKQEDLFALPIELAIQPLPVWLAVHREIRSTPRIRFVFDALAAFLKTKFQ